MSLEQERNRLDEPEDDSEGARLERLITSLGEYGRYQLWMTCLLALGAFMPAMPVVAMTFLAYEPIHRCQVVACEGNMTQTHYDAPFLNFTTPIDPKTHEWSGCLQRPFVGTDPTDPSQCREENFLQNATQGCEAGIVFEEGLFHSSIITEFDLWCASSLTKSLSGIVYMVGMLFSAFIMGNLSDRIGRRNVIALNGVIIALSGLVSAAAPNYIVFLLGRFFTGVGAVGLFQVTFVLGLEFIGAKYRTFIGIMIQTPFALGESMTGVLAYFIRDWRYLQLAVTLPSLLLVVYRWYLPESVRWLVTQNRTAEAVAIIKDIAKTNKKELRDEDLDFIINREKYNQCAAVSTEPEEEVQSTSVLDLLKTPKMRARSLNMFFAWAAVTLMYYGISFNSGNIGSNMFLSFILTMLIEIPSYVTSWLTLDCLGRKPVLIFMYFLGGISCVIAAVLDSEYYTTTVMVLTLGGKFGASAGFAIVYIYAGELFPTSYRGVAVGTCSTCARVGGLLAVILVELSGAMPSLPPIIFGVLGCVCGVMMLQLPETAGTILPQTMEECEAFGSDQKLLDCVCLSKRRNRVAPSPL